MSSPSTPFLRPLKKSAAIFLSLCLSLPECSLYASPASGLRMTNDISIPAEFGSIEESFSGTSGKTIITLQDAHDSLEAQENIAKIINDLVGRYGIKTVFEEGYEGPVPTDEYFSFIKDPKVKEKVSYFLMDKLRIGGAEYAHINRKKDFKLIGADSIKLHLENIHWYRENAKHREETEKDLAALQKEIDKLARRYFPKELKEWLKAKERFDRHELGVLDYVKRVSLLLASEDSHDPEPLEKVKVLDVKILFKEISRLEDDIARNFLKTPRDRQIFQVHKQLSILKRLAAIQLTSQEFKDLSHILYDMRTQTVADFIVRESKKSIVLSKRWEENIQDAMRFYKTSQARDEAIKTHLNGVLNSPDEKISILVFGGFHKERIKEILKEKHLSSLVVSPKITGIDPKHRDDYKRLMSVGYHPFEVPLYVRQAARAESRFLQVRGGLKIEAVFRTELKALSKIFQRNPGLDRSDFIFQAEQELPKIARSEARIEESDFQWSKRLKREFEAEKEKIWKGERSLQEKMLAYSTLTDEAVRKIFERVKEKFPDQAEQMSFVAMGSYGRREMILSSDADGAIVVEDLTPNQETIELTKAIELMNRLSIDSSIKENGWSVFELNNPKSWGDEKNDKDDKDDPLIKETEMIDDRFIVGAKEIEKKYRGMFRKKFFGQSGQLSGTFIQYWNERYKEAGHLEALFQREPVLKGGVRTPEGVGAIRWMNRTQWIAKAYLKSKEDPFPKLIRQGLLTKLELEEARKSFTFVLEMRNHLYEVRKQGSSTLDFYIQDELARHMGYRDDSATSALEKMLEDYYRNALVLLRFSFMVIRRIAERLDPPITRRGPPFPGDAVLGIKRAVRSGWIFQVHTGFVYHKMSPFLIPGRILKSHQPENQILPILRLSAEQGVPLSGDLLDLLARAAPRFKDKMKDAPFAREVRRQFSELLQSPRDISYVLWRLYLLGILPLLLPGFDAIEFKVRADFIHRYTRDVHAVKEAELLEELFFKKEEGLGEDDWGVSTREVAAKSMEKIKGDQIRVLRLALLLHTLYESNGLYASEHFIEPVLAALEIPEEEKVLIHWLHGKSHRLIEIMRRRTFRDPRRLKKFINDELQGDWSRWNLLLFMTLIPLRLLRPERYQFYLQELEPAFEITEEMFERPEKFAAWHQETERKRREAFEGRFGTILTSSLKTTASFEFDEKKGTTEVVVLHRGDRPGVLSKITGVLAASGGNIEIADIGNAGTEGMTFDRFIVSFPEVTKANEKDFATQLTQDFQDVLEDNASVPEIFARHGRSYNFRSSLLPLPAFQDKIPKHIRFETEEGFTWFNLEWPDQQGLLHIIARVLEEHGVNILPLSTIDTRGYDERRVGKRIGMQAVDTFALTRERRPLTEKLQKSIQSVLEELLNQKSINEKSFEAAFKKIPPSFRAEARQPDRLAGSAAVPSDSARSEVQAGYAEDTDSPQPLRFRGHLAASLIHFLISTGLITLGLWFALKFQLPAAALKFFVAGLSFFGLSLAHYKMHTYQKSRLELALRLQHVMQTISNLPRSFSKLGAFVTSPGLKDLLSSKAKELRDDSRSLIAKEKTVDRFLNALQVLKTLDETLMPDGAAISPEDRRLYLGLRRILQDSLNVDLSKSLAFIKKLLRRRALDRGGPVTLPSVHQLEKYFGGINQQISEALFKINQQTPPRSEARHTEGGQVRKENSLRDKRLQLHFDRTVHLKNDVVFTIRPGTLEKLARAKEAGEYDQWLELLGLKMLNKEELHLVIDANEKEIPGTRALELITEHKNVYWGWNKKLSQMAAEGIPVIQFEKLINGQISADLLNERSVHQISATFDIFKEGGSFIAALRLAQNPSKLKELQEQGKNVITSASAMDMGLTDQFFKTYAIVSQAA